MEETVLDIQQSITPEAIKEAVEKLDKRFEQNITIRRPLEDKWADYISMAVDGEEGSRALTLAKSYVNLSNSYYPAAWRQASAYRLTWLDDQWFEFTPDGEGIVDTGLYNAMESFVAKKLRHEQSNFYNAVDMFDLQAGLLGPSALGYSYEIKLKQAKQRTIEMQGGRMRVKRSEGPQEMLYQGAKAHFINMFNCYPDVLNPKGNIKESDLFHKCPVRLEELKNNPKFNPQAPYEYQDFVIYRDNQLLNQIDNPSYQKTDAQMKVAQKIERDLQQKPQNEQGYLELRMAYVEDFCCDCGAKKEHFENVVIIYVKNNSECIPLLVEYNHRDFNRKNILVMESNGNPWGAFGKSQLGLSYNQACWLNFIRASQAYQIGKTTFRTRFIPAQLYSAALSVGISKTDFEAGLRGAGYDIPYDATEYNQAANGIWSPDDNYEVKDSQMMDGEIQKVLNDLNQINIDLQSTDAGNSTATGVNFVQAKQAALYKKYLKNMSNNILKPFLEMFIEDLTLMIRDEVIAVDIDDERLAEINPDKEHLIQVFKTVGQELLQKKVVAMGQDGLPIVMGTKINPVLQKEYITLNQRLLQSFKAQVEVKIDGNEADLQQAKADNLELMNLVQGMGEGPGKDQALALTIEEYLDLRKNKNKAKYMNILKAQGQAQQQQAEMAEQQMAMQQQEANAKQMESEANSMNKQADTQLKAAQASEEQARADKQNIENVATAQLVGG